MALPEILDLIADFPGWSPSFEIMRRQERSRTASGRTLTKDIGDPLWTATYQSARMSANELDKWRALIDSLEEGGRKFYGRSLSRCYPILYPNGSWTPSTFNGTAGLASIGTNRKSITLNGLPSGFRLSVGDMIRIGTQDLHRVVEASTASAGGVTPLFEVRPHLWPLATVGQAVSVLRPYCLMSIVPGTISTASDAATGRGSFSFDAMEDR